MENMITRVSEFVDNNFHLIVTLPATIVVFLIVFFPAFYGLYTSFFVRDLLQQDIHFTGLGNYIELFQDSSFWFYLQNTAIYTAGATSISFTISLALAVALRKELRFKAIFIGAILLPWITPMAVSAVAWKWVLHSTYGILNHILMSIGVLAKPYFWLGKPLTAKIWLFVVEAWFEIPLLTLIIYAGLQRIPDMMYEIADIDGASGWQRFRHITIPLIQPEILMSLVLVSMFSFRRFAFPFLLTRGGPGGTTEILGLTIYKTGQNFLQQGYAAAMSQVMLVIILIFVFLYFRFFMSTGEEGSIGVEL